MRAAPNYQNPTNDYSDANDANRVPAQTFRFKGGPTNSIYYYETKIGD